MMLNDRVIRRVSLLTLLAPLVFAGAVRIVEPAPLPGPSAASAQTEEDEESARRASRRKVTERQVAAGELVQAQPIDIVPPNIFGYPRVLVQRVDITPRPDNTPALETPDFDLSSIMKTTRGDVALINGRLRHVGDEVEPEWFVVAVDPIARQATIEHVDGRTVVVKMPTGIGR